jgi:hypothetical protein
MLAQQSNCACSVTFDCPTGSGKRGHRLFSLASSPAPSEEHRSYFLCPGRGKGQSCGRSVVKLYLADGSFSCRNCCRLSCACQSEPTWDRAARRAYTIRERLGGTAGIYTPFPRKPKGMWWRTYNRLADQAFEAADIAERAILGRTPGQKGGVARPSSHLPVVECRSLPASHIR